MNHFVAGDNRIADGGFQIILGHQSVQIRLLRDITAIVLTLGDELDLEHIAAWAARKGLSTLWGEILSKIRAGGQINK